LRKIPATMSTQHPDDVNLPVWVKEETIEGDDEVHEAYYVYRELGCEEQMWDWEGKDVDPNIVRKLLSQYTDFFKEEIIGQDIFLTYRVPNPSIKGAERKVLIEALESIPRCFDIAQTFFGGKAVPPIFEVILPMTTTSIELLRVLSCYQKIIVGKEDMPLHDIEDITIGGWIGEFEPKKIEMIPLVENKESLSHIDRILKGYIKYVRPNYLRVFLARSDPALNYGLFPAVLLNKLALSKISRTSKETGVQMFPIVGTGSLPFRGHLMPDNIEGYLNEYAGVTTVTVQSALKYDFSEEIARSIVDKLNRDLKHGQISEMTQNQEKLIERIIDALKDQYQSRVESLSHIINYIAKFIPRRRARKLHIGLFGYGREVGKVSLPRAISFTASLYSLGIPPELLGASAFLNLKEKDWNLLTEVYKNWKEDLSFAAGFLCWSNLNYLMGEKEVLENVTNIFHLGFVLPEILKDLEVIEENFNIRLGPRDLDRRKHENIVNNILIAIARNSPEMKRYIEEAAKIRHSLG
jgi:phosphoenolpyruvate carboxylase